LGSKNIKMVDSLIKNNFLKKNKKIN
jgi:hypothetical protein